MNEPLTQVLAKVRGAKQAERLGLAKVLEVTAVGQAIRDDPYLDDNEKSLLGAIYFEYLKDKRP